MRKTVLFALAVFLLQGCSNKENASLLLEDAQSLFEKGSLNDAKLRIDSLQSTYPKEFNLIKQGRQLLRRIELKENERNYAYADSMLTVKQQQAQDMSKEFNFVKDEKYEELGNYIYKGLLVENNVQRSYIRTGVDEYGRIYIASVYYGNANINHTGMKAEIPDGSNVQTLEVPFDGGRNYRFSDGGAKSEIVTYNEEKENGIIGFIAANAGQRIKITYTGGKTYILYLDDFTKKAIVKTSEMAAVLKDIIRLQQEKKVSEGKITYLQNRISVKEEQLNKEEK